MEKEIQELDNQFTLIYTTIAEVLTFRGEFNKNNINSIKNTIIDIKPIFLSKLENYLQIHLIPEINKQLAINPQKLTVVFKELIKMIQHLNVFIKLIKSSKAESQKLEAETAELIRENISTHTNLLSLRKDMVAVLWKDYNVQIKRALTEMLKTDVNDGKRFNIQYLMKNVDHFVRSKISYHDALQIKKFLILIGYTNNQFERILLDYLNELSFSFIETVFSDHGLKEKPIVKLIDMFKKTYIIGFADWFTNESKANLYQKERITQSISETYNQLIVRKLSLKLFEYVFEYPTYSDRLSEMKNIINSKENLTEFTEPILRDINTKLLTISSSTKEIISFYINLLKFWSNVNKNYKILQKLTTSIKNYFLERKDALRYILDIWIAEVGEKKKRESQRRDDSCLINIPIAENNDFVSDDEPSDFDFVMEQEKKDSDKFKFKKSDVKTLLINLYGSREKFLLEYENFISEKILKFEIENVKEEFDNLNFLKDQLKNSEYKSKSEVLMNDLESSKNITRDFHDSVPESAKYHVMVLSKMFWPVNYEYEDFDISECHYLKFLDHFNEYYLDQTKNKRVKFHHNIGEVELEIESHGVCVDVRCQPINAILLMEVQEAGEFGISIQELADKLKTEVSYIKKKMQFWVHKKIIKMVKKKDQENPKSIAQLDDLDDKQNIAMLNKAESYLYLLNNDFIPTEELIVNDEDFNEQIQLRENTDAEGNENSTIKIENYIINILSKSGVKPVDKLFDLLKHIYKNHIPRTFDIKCLQKLVNKMLKKKQIMKRGKMYYVVN